MQDIIGRDLAVGDIVAFKFPYGKDLGVGTVIKIAKKTVRIEYRGTNWRGVDETMDSLAKPSNVVKLEGPDLTLYLLKNSG